MRSKWPLIAAIAVAGVVAAGVVAAVGIALGGNGGGAASKTAYQTSVVNARDRIDFALARIGKSQSVDELVQRINDASDTVSGAASLLETAKVAKGFEAENAKLVTTLNAFSAELANTAATFSDPSFGTTLANASSLSFPQWNEVNAILANMKSEGIDVQPLARH